MALVFEEYPLYYDAMNEKGLGMAGLNFVGNAKFYEVQEDKNNVAAFEFIPWILSQCASVKKARVVLENNNYYFNASGSVLKFDGYLRLYSPYEKKKDEILPELTDQEILESQIS